MSEFRQDLVSGDWIIVATERARRPDDFFKKKEKRKPSPKSSCPFEDLQKSGNWPPLLAWPDKKNWRTIVIPNKFPALKHNHVCAFVFRKGPYEAAGGVGHHELLITRDHTKNFAHLAPGLAAEAMYALQARYKKLAEDNCLRYVVSFFNWGHSAGASISHPHYQILSLPIIPPDVQHSLNGSHQYWKKHHRCVHCVMLAYERKNKIHIIAENKHAIAITPFVSRTPFEVRVYPKMHQPYFEKTPAAVMRSISEILQKALLGMEKHLQDPDLNFFIHTAPLKNQASYRHYHWHIEILPKMTVPAGFEISTGVDINVMDPDHAAQILRSGKWDGRKQK